MPFSTRNAYYLRASNYRTIPLFLYLDERHVDWMSDIVLQRVIGGLQTQMKGLLDESRARSYGPGAEKGSKHKVYVERGEGFQYCYFLRGTTRTEVVLLKQKTYSLRAPTPPPVADDSSDSPMRARSSSSRPTPSRMARRSRTRTRSVSIRPEDEEEEPEDENEEEEDVKPEIPEESETSFKDYKPDVSVTYKGFGTSSLQLVLIVEPYPPLPASSYAPPASRLSTRSASVASTSARSRTQASRSSRSGMSGSRYSTAPLESASVEPQNFANMRNASRSVSTTPQPNSRRGGTASATPFGSSVGPDGSDGPSRSRTPLFLPGPRDTPFDMDEEDEEAHERYTAALREGRVRLPSVSRPAGGTEMGKNERRNLKRRIEEEEDELDGDDEPEGMEKLGERLMKASEMEEGVVRVTGGWEERAVGESSEVLGREEAGE